MADERPSSRGTGARMTRRGAAPSEPAAAAADEDEGGEVDGTWKAEMESIMSGTHPTLVEALKPHEERMKTVVSQADRVRQLQIININALCAARPRAAGPRAAAPARSTAPRRARADRARARARRGAATTARRSRRPTSRRRSSSSSRRG